MTLRAIPTPRASSTTRNNAPTYQVTVRENVWMYNGELQDATFEFNDDGKTMKTHWDWRKSDGENWLPLSLPAKLFRCFGFKIACKLAFLNILYARMILPSNLCDLTASKSE